MESLEKYKNLETNLKSYNASFPILLSFFFFQKTNIISMNQYNIFFFTNKQIKYLLLLITRFILIPKEIYPTMKHDARRIIPSFFSRIACRLCNDIPTSIIIRLRIKWRRVIINFKSDYVTTFQQRRTNCSNYRYDLDTYIHIEITNLEPKDRCWIFFSNVSRITIRFKYLSHCLKHGIYNFVHVKVLFESLWNMLKCVGRNVWT